MNQTRPWWKNRFQLWGSLTVSLLLVLGVSLLYHDLVSLITQQRNLLERTVLATAHLIPSPLVEQVLATKDSQTESDSQLQDLLFALQSEFKVSGSLTAVDIRSNPPRNLASTKPNIRKGEAYTFIQNPLQNSYQESSFSTSLHYVNGSFWITAYVPLRTSKGEAHAYLILDSLESPLVYRLFGFGLHYLLWAITLLTLGGFFYYTTSSRSQRLLETSQSRLSALFRETSDGILFLDHRGQILRSNPAALKTFAENLESVIGRSLLMAQENQFAFIPIDTSKDIIRNTLQKGEKFRSRAKVLLKNDVIRYLNFSSQPYQETNGTIGALVIFQDITSEIVREQELYHYQVQGEDPQLKVLTDPLTKLLNRQYLAHFLDPTNLRWVAYEGCSLLIVNLDEFKRTNSERGFAFADYLLQQFANVLKSFFRKADRILRYEGDTFVILLSRTNLKAAEKIAQNLKEELKKNPADEIREITISIGISELQPNESGKEWFGRAEAALYDAKKAGKNRIEVLTGDELQILG